MKLRRPRRYFELEDVPVDEWFEGASYADIERVVIRAVKSMALDAKEFLTIRDMREAVEAESRRRAWLDDARR